ncbi:LuxR C-terminal-related transcriptional regulator [Dactylosporangium sucinum]|uniref:LuxR C-terminal-related transcriptional regulator n=1 Tax=Dactylosporangium sucinum TaxID=1424081 RepID=UPI00167D4066|nr:LuxR C-terminal-related transcriptional regulator [Dactylosporangium sucinum]
MAHNDAAERFLGASGWTPSAVRPMEIRSHQLDPRPDDDGVPELPGTHLARARLLDQLDAAVAHPVTLLCAPTGWGKTVLATSWIRSGRAPGRTAYVRFEANCGAAAWRQMTTALTAAGIAVDPATYAWSNAQRHERAVVVLDDLHNVTNLVVLRRLERLIARLGERISFFILARSEPPLSLYRWRVRGQLIELRTDHLSFTHDEVAGLAAGYDVRLAQHFRYSLWHVTEGWPAAVAVILAAMVGRHEPERIITDLLVGDSGLNEGVGLGEYVRREILQHLDPDLREVMLRTSILETVCPGLVEALTGSRGGARLLAQMSRANALATFYGGSHSWYRYRRLLRAVLRAEVRTTLPAEERNLHRAAAGWYAANGLPSDALAHAAAGGDWITAERIFFQYWPELIGSGPRVLSPRAGPRPPQDIAERPLLAFALAVCCRDTGDHNGMSAFIRLGERALGESPGATQAEILAALRVAEGTALEDPQRSGTAAVRLLARTEEATGEHLYADSTDAARAVAYLALSGAELAGGSVDEAEAALERGAELARTSGFNLLVAQANRQQAIAHLMRGRLSAAAACARRVIDGCRDAGIAEARSISYARLVLAAVCRERGQLDEARFHLEESISAHTSADPGQWVAGALAFAQLLHAQDDHAGAAEALEPLLGWRSSALTPTAGVAVGVLHADLCLLDGYLDKARDILDDTEHLRPGDPEVALASARVSLAEGNPAAAARTVERVLAVEPVSLVTTVAAMVLLAQALRQLGDLPGATERIERALRLAGPENIRLPFIGHGSWISELLDPPDDRSLPPAPVPVPVPLPGSAPAAATAPTAAMPEPEGVAEPVSAPPVIDERLTEQLTERETLVLQYLRSMLSIAEIATVLSVSANTVKTHVRHVYRKLGVSRRRDAVRRGRELSLI